MKNKGLKPIIRTESYLKYGFIKTECESYYCPKCGFVLNAGPNYKPNFCSNCGQRIDFSGTIWTEEREQGIDPEKFREASERRKRTRGEKTYA